MAVARKSAVSVISTWLGRDSALSLGKRRPMRLKSATQRASALANELTPVPSRKQQRPSKTSKNLSVVATKNLAQPTSGQQLSKQPVEQSQNLKLSFFKVPMMPSSRAVPMWLMRFYTLHRYSSVATFLLVATTLVVYGWTVYSQELWSQNYRRLQNLQRQERQLTTTNATLTNKMADDAEKSTAGLDLPNPARTIFLPPADQSPDAIVPRTIPNAQTQEQSAPSLGY